MHFSFHESFLILEFGDKYQIVCFVDRDIAATIMYHRK